jgi:hypothetical protein
MMERMITQSPQTLFIFALWASGPGGQWLQKKLCAIRGQRFRLAHRDMKPRPLPCAVVDKLLPNVEPLNDVAHHASTNE